MVSDIDIPDGFLRKRVGRRQVVMLADSEDALTALGFVEGNARVAPLETIAGRVEHPIYHLPGTETRVLWKRCMRGGLMEPLLGDRHFGIERFLAEIHQTQAALEAGLRVARPLGLAIEDSPVGFKRVEMVSFVVEGARDLGDALTDQTLPPAELQELLGAVAGELRRFHGQGFLHGDLNVKNILWRTMEPVTGEPECPGCEVTFIDLDPGAWRAARGLMDPQKNLMRLFRSYVKGESRGRWSVPTTDLYRFLRTYFRGDRTGIAQFWDEARRKRQRWNFLRWRGGRPTSNTTTPEGSTR